MEEETVVVTRSLRAQIVGEPLACRSSFTAKTPSSSALQRPSSPIFVGFTIGYSIAMQVFSRRTAGVLQAAARRQAYSTATSGYAATAENLRINSDTKVIFQGFTGKQGRYAIGMQE